MSFLNAVALSKMIVNVYISAKRKIDKAYPWVFLESISNQSVLVTAEDQDIAHVYDNKGEFLGSGLIDRVSNLAVRIFSARKYNELPLEEFLRQAQQKRDGKFQQNFYRLCNAEGDNLPGLVIDRFGDIFSIEMNMTCWLSYKEQLISILTNLYMAKGFVVRVDDDIRVIGQVPQEIQVIENDVRFVASLVDGQKTGYYFDQRDNHGYVGSLASDKKVLDAFCYTGGFGVQAMSKKASRVVFVDSSASALQLLDRSILANDLNSCDYELIKDDVLKYMNSCDEKFDIVILDPPPFIKRKADVFKARVAYHRLASSALKLLNHNGVLLFSTCSHHMHISFLQDEINKAAKKLNLAVNLVYKSGHAVDHPTHPKLPETRYLNTVAYKLS